MGICVYIYRYYKLLFTYKYTEPYHPPFNFLSDFLSQVHSPPISGKSSPFIWGFPDSSNSKLFFTDEPLYTYSCLSEAAFSDPVGGYFVYYGFEDFVLNWDYTTKKENLNKLVDFFQIK